MIYRFENLTSASTAEVDADVVTQRVIGKLITKVDVDFPAGCEKLAHCQIFEGNHQIWPSADGSSFSGNFVTLTFPETYELAFSPTFITVLFWNDDDTHDHTMTVRLTTLTEKELEPQRRTNTLLERLVKRLGG